MISVGDVYFWNDDVPYFMKAFENRFVVVLAVTLTHVYVMRHRTRSRVNIPIDQFKAEYVLRQQPRMKNTGYSEGGDIDV